ncbi:MAG: M48 family metalloprotease [Candidatus Tectomicrobia bacterium]|uniref:M48 family metalloprotease n=1 Tax=Tectimicrobiota bacterium TaxID=2528274 RepID=A0A932CR58_UNCTE|nr:M48 family metalloprotease [Candidatus Tectomicrobia bacterium]
MERRSESPLRRLQTRRAFYRFLWPLVLLGVMACGLNLVSQDKEVELGKQVAKEVENQLPVLIDPEITEYIDSIGQKLARLSRRADLTYHIRVIDTEEINAFALPGGYLYVNRGLIEAASTESELAGVMGHEIAHITERHSTKQYTQAQLYQIAATIGAAVTGAGTLGVEAAGLGGALLFRKFSRMDEAEADYYGLQYMSQAGYDPQGMVTFFEKLLRLQDNKLSTLQTLFSTHPPTEERVQEIKAQIKKLDPKYLKASAPSSISFDQIKTKLRVKSQLRQRD